VQNYFLTPPPLRPTLGALLVETLFAYGTRNFDPRRFSVQICADGTGPLVPLTPAGATARFVPRVGTSEYWQPADPVVIQDPVDPSNNVGKACFGFRQVQLAFDHALRAIQQKAPNTTAQKKKNCSALGAAFGSVEGDTKHHDSVIRHLRAVWCPTEAGALSAEDERTALLLPGDALCEIEELRKLLNTRAPLSVGDVDRVQRTFRSLKDVTRPELKEERSPTSPPAREPQGRSAAFVDLRRLNNKDLRTLVGALRAFARDRDHAWATGNPPAVHVDQALADLARTVLGNSPHGASSSSSSEVVAGEVVAGEVVAGSLSPARRR